MTPLSGTISRLARLAIAVVIAGCSGAGGGTAAPTSGPASPATTQEPSGAASPSPAPTVLPPATAEPSPVRWGDAALVHGTETCMPGNLLIPAPDPEQHHTRS